MTRRRAPRLLLLVAAVGALATARFWEPSGLSVGGSRLYVADTNNHAIRVIDGASGTVQTLDIQGVTA